VCFDLAYYDGTFLLSRFGSLLQPDGICVEAQRFARLQGNGVPRLWFLTLCTHLPPACCSATDIVLSRALPVRRFVPAALASSSAVTLQLAVAYAPCPTVPAKLVYPSPILYFAQHLSTTRHRTDLRPPGCSALVQ